MNDAVRGGANIAAVERETGLGKDTLRVWERRYGFPQPLRDENGDRLYPTDQVSRLRLIKRLMDRGHRPGRLVQASDEVLQELSLEASHSLPGNLALTSAKPLGKEQEAHSEFFNLVFERILQHDLVGLRVLLSQCLAKEGLKRFVMDIVPRLNARVGEGWENGSVQVFEEHLYTEQIQVLLRQAIASLPPGTRQPAVLLTTVPEEQHVLGILMLEALLILQGVRCVSLGTQTPLAEIVSAAQAHRVDVVALSFSAAFPARQVLPLVEQLRARLPLNITLWIGGAGLGRDFEKRLGKSLRKSVLEAASPEDSDTLLASDGIIVGRSLNAAFELTEHARAALAA